LHFSGKLGSLKKIFRPFYLKFKNLIFSGAGWAQTLSKATIHVPILGLWLEKEHRSKTILT